MSRRTPAGGRLGRDQALPTLVRSSRPPAPETPGAGSSCSPWSAAGAELEHLCIGLPARHGECYFRTPAGAGSLPPPANARQALPRRHRRRSCSTPTIRSRCASPSMCGPYCQYMLDRSGTLRSRRPCFSAACRSRRIRRSSSFRAWPTSWGRRVMGPGGAMPRRAALFVLRCRFRFCARQTHRAQGAGVARRRETRA